MKPTDSPKFEKKLKWLKTEKMIEERGRVKLSMCLTPENDALLIIIMTG